MKAVSSVKAGYSTSSLLSLQAKSSLSKRHGSADALDGAHKLVQKTILHNSSLKKHGSQEKILRILGKLQAKSKNHEHKQFLSHLSDELKTISKVPYERHKLSPLEI
ncbi:MAG: hypothetical protein JSR46_06200, partial [Verrucomicrobia bacterium]|nr:hypothetical protein [Verrucomicrobiota bacterium]